MNIAVLSNVNLDMLASFVSKKNILFETEGYGQWVTYALTLDEKLLSFQPKIIFLLLDGNALFENVDSLEDGLIEIERNIAFVQKMAVNYPSSLLAVSLIDISVKRIRSFSRTGVERIWEGEWARELLKMSSATSNVVIFDLKGLVEREGTSKFYSPKTWYLGSIPYGVKALGILAKEIETYAERYSQTRRKVLVCDLDNTLWGGVVGEDGVMGITLSESLVGSAYRDAQKRIKEIAKTGVLLAVASKNNKKDVENVFRSNPFMVLKESDFVSVKANWRPKSENIAEIAQDLNLGLDSFVFLDDNPVEREEVRASLPQVTVVDFPKDVALLPQVIDDVYRNYFASFYETSEDLQRTEQYKQEAQRKDALKSVASLDDYLRELNILVELGEVKSEQYTRVVQLLNKTNQFNTNTVRMDEQEFASFLSDSKNKVYVANVSDKYGDSGLVVVLLARLEDGVCRVVNFLMSCRVMGRKIENAVIQTLKARWYEAGIGKVIATYKRTEKNKPVEQLWDRLGFPKIDETEDCKEYRTVLVGETPGSLLKVEWKS